MDLLLKPTVGRTVDLLWGVPKKDFHAHEGKIFPDAERGCGANDLATSTTLRATASVLVRLNRQMQFLVSIFEPKTGDFHVFQA
jgi:hypothetical protein